jgi:hypothetical protein
VHISAYVRNSRLCPFVFAPEPSGSHEVHTGMHQRDLVRMVLLEITGRVAVPGRRAAPMRSQSAQ